jgi:hypothetical protein
VCVLCWNSAARTQEKKKTVLILALVADFLSNWIIYHLRECDLVSLYHIPSFEVPSGLV